MPKWEIITAGNSSAEITLKNQTISDMQCCRDSEIRYSEEGGRMENLFENRRPKTAPIRTNPKWLNKSEFVWFQIICLKTNSSMLRTIAPMESEEKFALACVAVGGESERKTFGSKSWHSAHTDVLMLQQPSKEAFFLPQRFFPVVLIFRFFLTIQHLQIIIL